MTMRSILQGLSREDLVRFAIEFDYAVDDLLSQAGESEGDNDEEKAVGAWIVSQGSSLFAGVFDNPGRFPTEVLDGGSSFYGFAEVALEERFPAAPVTDNEIQRLGRWPTVSGAEFLSRSGGV
jgi:hypothetical protein